jgi:hypothetical protein
MFSDREIFYIEGFTEVNAKKPILSVIKSSDETFLIFNTALLHGAIPAEDDDKAFRLIYSFILNDQFDEVNNNIHLKTREKFNDF